MKYKYFTSVFFICFFVVESFSQIINHVTSDTINSKDLDSVLVYGRIGNNIHFLREVDGINIYAGKKTNLVNVEKTDANLSQGIIREIFAKIPGLTSWDMDGAGTQINIGTRGTDSHRSIEMNMRQNGYNTNSDIFGYPEDHYTPPMQAVQSVQLVRGAAALQYGSQFGGMMNYILKDADTTKSLALQTDQTVGSNNFYNSFTSIGGTSNKLSYYSYFDYRHGDGWRPNSVFNYHAYYLNLKYILSKKASVALQFSRMDYVQQIAGGLTDIQFNQNSKQSFRTRNFFNPEINIPAIIFNYHFSKRTQLQVITHTLFGQRNSVQFINTPNILDTFNTGISSYNPRQVDRDYYSGFTTETKLSHQYQLFNHQVSTLVTGIRFFNEVTKRKQKGVGTTGSDFDLSIISPYKINLKFSTFNTALFAENIFQITKRLSITPGIRYEIINSTMNGYITGNVNENYSTGRNFLLAGIGLQYDLNNNRNQFYANVSQEYRPNLYAVYTPSSRVDSIDANLKDCKGYNIDAGFRGSLSNIFQYDFSLFYVYYGNRTGLISINTPTSSINLLTTNVGDAVSKGIEAYAELSFAKWLSLNTRFYDVRIFNTLSYTHARYVDASVTNSNGDNVSIDGNYVENVPEWNEKVGIQFQYKRFNTQMQYTYVSKSYNDAFNTVYSSNGVTGIIPAYHLVDFMTGYSFKTKYRFEMGINNLLNAKYFSRRITMYPGPGILPADGRTFYMTLKLNL